MKKILASQIVFFFAFFILFTVYRRWLNLSFIPFWVGGLIGFLLPFSDYLIYVYLLKPQEKISLDIKSLISQKKILKAYENLLQYFSGKRGLLIHSALFQTLLLVFALWMVTSGTLLAMGLVLAFMLHLILDQAIDLAEKRSIDGWYEGFPLDLDRQQKILFLVFNFLVFSYFGFFF